MYYLNEEGKKLLSNFKLARIAKMIGINASTLNDIVKRDRRCMKLTAYCLTKLLNEDAEIEQYFIREDK